MPQKGASESVEDFIKTVYTLQQTCERVSTNALKDALGITAPSVTDMARRLEESGLVDYLKYRGVRLTEEGESMALGIIRRHRLIELYLVQELGYALHEVHDEAENLEHAVSERFIAAIAEKLGNPRYDPHGDPIPDVDGTMSRRELHPLSEMLVATPGRVSRLLTNDPDMLQHTLERGFQLGTRVIVLARDPFQGPLTIELNGDEVIIGHSVAANILVEVE